eukprot:1195942-Prorocentrum_minimum.AAC.1
MTSAAARREYSPLAPPRPSIKKPAAMTERAKVVVRRRPQWSINHPAAPDKVRSTRLPAEVKAPTSTAPNPRLCTASGMASERPCKGGAFGSNQPSSRPVSTIQRSRPVST